MAKAILPVASKKQTKHTAQALFQKNLSSVDDCVTLYEGINTLRVGIETSWLLRAAVVFLVSAMDTYFHDKIKYGISKLGSLNKMPPALRNHKISVEDLFEWDKSERKGNVLRNWISEHLSYVPLQSSDKIQDYLRYIGISGVWNQIEPDNKKRKEMLDKLNEIIKRRNQIAHEGDRQTARGSGKKLRNLDLVQVKEWRSYIVTLVEQIEKKAKPKAADIA